LPFFIFCIFFLSSQWNSTKPEHATACQYSAQHYSGIIYYISQQSHVMHQFGLWNLVVLHIIRAYSTVVVSSGFSGV
jgi:hypothetical protein